MQWTKEEFEMCARESAPRFIAVINRILRNDAEAEDALQETFMAAWRSRANFDGRSSMKTWIHRIAVNTALNKLKQVSSRSSRTNEYTDTIEDFNSTKQLSDLELRQVINLAMDKLSDDQRLVMILRDVEEFSSEEVAEQLNLSTATVRQRLHRARKHIAEILMPELCGADEMTCGGRLDLLLDMIDGILDEDVREPVLDHVKKCTICQGYAAGYKRTIAIPRETAEESLSLPEGFLDRIFLKIFSTH